MWSRLINCYQAVQHLWFDLARLWLCSGKNTFLAWKKFGDRIVFAQRTFWTNNLYSIQPLLTDQERTFPILTGHLQGFNLNTQARVTINNQMVQIFGESCQNRGTQVPIEPSDRLYWANRQGIVLALLIVHPLDPVSRQPITIISPTNWGTRNITIGCLSLSISWDQLEVKVDGEFGLVGFLTEREYYFPDGQRLHQISRTGAEQILTSAPLIQGYSDVRHLQHYFCDFDGLVI